MLFRSNDKVHMVVSMRSSDLILGIAYDVPAFTLFQELLANQLSRRLNKHIDVGEYTHVSNSLHIYEKHFEMAEDILKKKEIFSLEMPALPTSEIPLQTILAFEAECRTASTADHLESIVSNCNTGSDYWDDWCKILASHRAGKFKTAEAEKVRSKLLYSTSFSGYNFFNK